MAGTAAIPLAVLRPDLERWHWPAAWVPNGVDAFASLAQPAGSEIVFRVRGAVGAQLRATVALALPERTVGLHRVAVSLRRPGSGARTLWRGRLARIGARQLPRELVVRASLDFDDEAELVLSAGSDVRWDRAAIELPSSTGSPPPPTANGEAGEHPPPATPLISVLMPVHDPPPPILEAAIASVRAQTMTDWELCIADDGSRDERVRAILAAAADQRVKVVRRGQAGGISAATNSALELAVGEYIALLDHDDELTPDALAEVAAVLRARPETDWVYSDEEVFDDDIVIHAYLKPGWSPDLLRSQMYSCHLGVYRRRLAEEIGGFRPDFDGSQDYDFALRVSERTDRIVHIPRVLYRWRAHAGSVAGNPHSKPGAYPAARRAIGEHLERTTGGGDTHFGPAPGLYRVIHEVDPGLRVGVVVASERPDGLAELRASLADPAVAGLAAERVVLVAPARVLAGVPDSTAVERIECGEESSAEAMLARGVGRCQELDVIVLLEGAMVPLTRRWLARLAGFAVQPRVGAVGAKVISVSGLVEQAGLAVFDGIPVPLMSGSGAHESGPLAMAVLPSNVAAVAGAVAVPGTAFRELGGLDPDGGLVLPDYCLRAGREGLRSVLAPDAILRRPAGRAALNDLAATDRFSRRWRGVCEEPYFTLARGWPGAEIAYPIG
jgi:GT2 family glycosyltransferase